jgi:hypothetical protein
MLMDSPLRLVWQPVNSLLNASRVWLSNPMVKVRPWTMSIPTSLMARVIIGTTVLLGFGLGLPLYKEGSRGQG